MQPPAPPITLFGLPLQVLAGRQECLLFPWFGPISISQPNMTRLTATFAILFVTLAFAQDARPSDPKELTDLRESWKRARDQATLPIDKKYVDALSAMKMRLTKAGDLSGALAVEAEIKTIFPTASTSTSQATAGAETVNTKKELEKHLLGKKWKMSQVSSGKGWGVWEFKPDGTIQVNSPRKWIIKDKRTVMIEAYEAKFSDDLTSFVVIWGDTGELKGTIEAPQP